MLIDRKVAVRLGRETIAILDAGEYVAPSGTIITIRDAVDRSISGTRSYPPDTAIDHAASRDATTAVEVCNESTLTTARRLHADGLAPVALNFASAKNPGGGFLGGARAQEESIARASGLHACISGQPMYEHHKQLHDPIYSAWCLYSPRVPVFRDDAGNLLEAPVPCSFLTAAAPNANAVLARDPARGPELRAALALRIERVLAIAAAHDHEAIVLGAWGCGAFGNDPALVAELFGAALCGPYAGTFTRVCFSILDWSPEQRFIGPFRTLIR
jgi:uncharacterized protein (TIGR02452 family)